MKRKVLYISGTRADYGLMLPVLRAIDRSDDLSLEIVATGMHLMPEFGSTVELIKEDGFEPIIINAIYERDDCLSTTNFISIFMRELIKVVTDIRPDIILLLGDRAEMLAGAIVGAYLLIPVAHIHGGDLSSTVDEIARHAITKLAHIHFPATRRSAERLEKMGEEKWRIFLSGSPAVDSIYAENLVPQEAIARKYDLDLEKPIILLIQHPVTTEYDAAAAQIRETLEAVVELKYQTVIIYPNADPGGRAMINVIREYERYPFIKAYKNLPRIDYLSLMRVASVMIGNSSSGIIEAPSFKLPVVNIGTRQDGREKAANVIDVGYNKNEILDAVKRALFDKEYRLLLGKCVNPYGNGRASETIVKVLTTIKIDSKLLQKRTTL